MGLRSLLGRAVDRMDAFGDRMHAAEVAKLSPAERERYEYWERRGEAARNGTPPPDLGPPQLVGKVLQGPAGRSLHGVDKLKRGPELEDPVAWEQQLRVERAARDEVRAQYLAAERHPVRISRVAAISGTQLQEVVDHLGACGLAARPDLVYGAYRVPDVISPARIGGERSSVVEWDIVHAAAAPLPPAPPPSFLRLDAREGWVLREPGEPRPLDEDLALDILARAGVGPERTLAIARDFGVERSGGGEDGGSSRIDAVVRGMQIVVAPDAGAAVGAAATGAPWRLPGGPPEGVVVDVLQWDALAQAVHPVRQHRAPLPSPFPYLPLDPQELLRSYLGIVGLAPADTYSAQVTYDRRFDLMPRTSRSAHVRRTGGGPELPCADGKPRKRMAGGHHVVVAYRDRPAYADGRARFDAYAERELCAFLRRGLGLRAPVPEPPNRLERTVDRVSGVVEFFSMEAWYDGGEEDPPRYCRPPGR